MTFGQYIRSLRKTQGITQRALSKAVGFRSLAHLSDIESDKRMPARNTFAKFAKALDISVKDLENRDIRECMEAAKLLFAKKPEMVGAFLQVIAAARKLNSEELVARVLSPAKVPAGSAGVPPASSESGQDVRAPGGADEAPESAEEAAAGSADVPPASSESGQDARAPGGADEAPESAEEAAAGSADVPPASSESGQDARAPGGADEAHESAEEAAAGSAGVPPASSENGQDVRAPVVRKEVRQPVEEVASQPTLF